MQPALWKLSEATPALSPDTLQDTNAPGRSNPVLKCTMINESHVISKCFFNFWNACFILKNWEWAAFVIIILIYFESWNAVRIRANGGKKVELDCGQMKFTECTTKPSYWINFALKIRFGFLEDTCTWKTHALLPSISRLKPFFFKEIHCLQILSM